MSTAAPPKLDDPNPRAFKHWFDSAYLDRMANAVRASTSAFDEPAFRAALGHLDTLELKDRVRAIAAALHTSLKLPFPQAADALVATLGPPVDPSLPNQFQMGVWPMVHFVGQYGLEHFEPSLAALHAMTQRMSAEFDIRPFLIRYPDATLARLQVWVADDSEHVRRLVSEGTRPRLPWGARLQSFIADPSPILPLLERLKDDPSAYVRRSVGNNLNDIAKDHPALVLRLAKSWLGRSAETDWVVKHGCRTLLKRGNTEALALFGWAETATVQIKNLELKNPTFPIGAHLEFVFELQHDGDGPCDLRLEYAIDYLKSNGKHNRKVFKITENSYHPGEVYRISRRQSFQDMTTRKHYPGLHRLAIVVNGKDSGGVEFEVVS